MKATLYEFASVMVAVLGAVLNFGSVSPENCQKDLAKIIVFGSKGMFLALFSDKMFPNVLKLQLSNYDY